MSERELREALTFLADESNWLGGFAAYKEQPLVFGHDQPWEIARDVLDSNPPSASNTGNRLLEAERQRREKAEALLRRIREWDILSEASYTADAPYWRAEIDRLLSPSQPPESEDG